MTTPGRPVRMLTSGRLSGRPQVLLLPGLGSVGYLREVLHACGGWTRTSLLDLPGFGNRRTADLPADLGSLTTAVASLLEDPAFAGPPAVLLGHSTGSQVALRAAVAVPGRVHALVLVGPTFEPAARRSANLAMRHLRTSMYEPPGQMRYTVPDYARGGRRFTQYLRSALNDRPEDRIGQVLVPVLVARGRRDYFSSQPWVERLADTASQGEAHILPGAHNVPYLHPGSVAHLIGRACSPRAS